MTTDTTQTNQKEQTIFNYITNSIQTEDRDIKIIAKFEDPLIVVLGNVLSDAECDELIHLSKDRLQRSKIGDNREIHTIRTSSSMFFQDDEHPLIAKIEKRIASITTIPVEHAEGLQILNYKPGQEYKAHHDYFSPHSKAANNNRISTLVIYLNEVEQGGETFFPELNIAISPQKGMAVYFEYFYQDETLNARTLHGGAPVVRGEKWVATQWMRKQKVR